MDEELFNLIVQAKKEIEYHADQLVLWKEILEDLKEQAKSTT